MLRCITLRLALPLLLASALFQASAFAQSQDSQSVAEAARRAREQKKAPAKPSKVVTDDDIKRAAQAASASPAPPEAAPAATPAPPSADAAASAPAGASAAPGAKDEKASKEIADLKEQIKQAQSDLDLLQREQALEQDNYYSKPDYVHDLAGKAKLDAMKQQISDKQQELDRLKARLAELHPPQENPATTPPKP